MLDNKKDIMSSILEGRHAEEEENRIGTLDGLVYKSNGAADGHPTKMNQGDGWQAEKDNVSVQVWEDKAKIKVKVSQGKTKKISMKRIASIAVDAILEELKKED